MNTFEVILIGTGGGYGESIVAKLCDHYWIVVDSCVNPNTGEPLPINYLKSVGVNVETEVKLVVCSHWHDDHIRGLDKILDECKCASFALAVTTDHKKLLSFIEFDSRSEKKESSSTLVLSQCLHIMSERSHCTTIRTLQDRILLSDKIDGNEIKVISLSPSDETLAEFEKEISDLMQYASQTNIKLPDINPNDKSTVLLIKVNQHAVILGADLENKRHKCWSYILENSICMKNEKISLVKIPHHGSETSYEEKLWKNYVKCDIVGQLSPFKKASNFIPTKDMISKYFDKTSHLYITSYPNKPKSKDRNKTLEKAIQQMNPTFKEIQYKWGTIISKINLDSTSPQWHTELHGNAFEIDQTFIDGLI